MRIVVFGCRPITIKAIKYIIDKGHDVVLVVTHDELRDKIYGDVLVKEYCDVNNIPNIRFDKKVDYDTIKRYNPDIIFSIYYRNILSPDILKIPRLGCINIHPAFLPKGRGPAPTMWMTLENKYDWSGSTIHYMDSEVDCGDIIDQQKLDMSDKTGFELNRDLMNLCYTLFEKNFDDICAGRNKRIPQDNSIAEHCLPFKKSIRYIMWDNPDSVIRKIRTFTKPFEGAITYTAKYEKVLMWDGVIMDRRVSLKPPGSFSFSEGKIIVQTSTFPILITDFDIIDKLGKSGRFVSDIPVDKYFMQSGENK